MTFDDMLRGAQAEAQGIEDGSDGDLFDCRPHLRRALSEEWPRLNGLTFRIIRALDAIGVKLAVRELDPKGEMGGFWDPRERLVVLGDDVWTHPGMRCFILCHEFHHVVDPNPESVGWLLSTVDPLAFDRVIRRNEIVINAATAMTASHYGFPTLAKPSSLMVAALCWGSRIPFDPSVARERAEQVHRAAVKAIDQAMKGIRR